jgi:8-oxo-dGTP pyrophosphatase MutT (NUDIX family)
MPSLEKEIKPTTLQDKEIVPAMFSAGLLLTAKSGDSLILVQNRKTGLWGIPSGHLKVRKEDGVYTSLEDPKEAALRETVEETDLAPDQIITSPLFNILVKQHSSGGMSIGYIFKAYIKDDSSLTSCYQPESSEISHVRVFNRGEVADELLLHPERIRVPEFNERLLRYWIADSLVSRHTPFEGEGFGFSLLISNFSDVVSPEDLDLFGGKKGKLLWKKYQENLA